jgi:hypothetical protein
MNRQGMLLGAAVAAFVVAGCGGTTATGGGNTPAVKISAVGRVRNDLGTEVSSPLAVGASEVHSVNGTRRVVNVTLDTPEGGFEGPSTQDMDALVSVTLAKVYGEAHWKGDAYVVFEGGLIDTANGRPLPDAPTTSYRMQHRLAQQVEWSNEQALYNINWSLYRTYCSPVIKGCPG